MFFSESAVDKATGSDGSARGAQHGPPPPLQHSLQRAFSGIYARDEESDEESDLFDTDAFLCVAEAITACFKSPQEAYDAFKEFYFLGSKYPILSTWQHEGELGQALEDGHPKLSGHVECSVDARADCIYHGRPGFQYETFIDGVLQVGDRKGTLKGIFQRPLLPEDRTTFPFQELAALVGCCNRDTLSGDLNYWKINKLYTAQKCGNGEPQGRPKLGLCVSGCTEACHMELTKAIENDRVYSLIFDLMKCAETVEEFEAVAETYKRITAVEERGIPGVQLGMPLEGESPRYAEPPTISLEEHRSHPYPGDA